MEGLEKAGGIILPVETATAKMSAETVLCTATAVLVGMGIVTFGIVAIAKRTQSE